MTHWWYSSPLVFSSVSLHGTSSLQCCLCVHLCLGPRSYGSGSLSDECNQAKIACCKLATHQRLWHCLAGCSAEYWDQGCSASILNNNHEWFGCATLDSSKNPVPIHHPPSVIFSLPKLTFINLHHCSRPSNDNWVVKGVLGTDIPTKIEPVNRHSHRCPSLSNCTCHTLLSIWR